MLHNNTQYFFILIKPHISLQKYWISLQSTTRGITRNVTAASSPVNDATHSQGIVDNRNVGLAAVRIESVVIEDLLAFKAYRLNYNRYNVIGGPNNSGKTNVSIWCW